MVGTYHCSVNEKGAPLKKKNSESQVGSYSTVVLSTTTTTKSSLRCVARRLTTATDAEEAGEEDGSARFDAKNELRSIRVGAVPTDVIAI